MQREEPAANRSKKNVMMTRLPGRLLGDDDAIEDIQDSLESLVEAFFDLLRLLARFLGLLPDKNDDDDNDDDDDDDKSSNTKWMHLGLALLLPLIIAILYRYFHNRRNKDHNKEDDREIESSSSASSSSESLPEEKSSWFTKYSVRLKLQS